MVGQRESVVETTSSEPHTPLHTSEKRQKSEENNSDPSLMPEPRYRAGRPASWETKTPVGGHRGCLFNPLPENARRAMTLMNFLECDNRKDFENRLAWAIKDYARGAEDFLKPRPFFTEFSDSVSAAETFKACKGDARIYRAILRVYDNGHLVDADFIREVMLKLSKSVGCPIAWIAAIHAKPTVADERNRHAHVIIRGVTQRNERFRLSSEIRRKGFAPILSEIMTRKVGPMTKEEFERMELISEANKERAAHLQGLGWRKRWQQRKRKENECRT